MIEIAYIKITNKGTLKVLRRKFKDDLARERFVTKGITEGWLYDVLGYTG